LPEHNTILIKSSTSTGSLIHEYIHHLQSNNIQPFKGKLYKKERNAIQKELIQQMDSKIEIIQNLEKQGKHSELQNHMPEFMYAANSLQDFAPWQDLIDERSIFLLFINHAEELKIHFDDVSLAKQNMRYICESAAWKNKLSKNECLPE